MSRDCPPRTPRNGSSAIIIPFPVVPYVAITMRTIVETTRVTSDGTVRVRHDPPLLSYFIDYQDEDGFTCCVWDGSTYDGALAVARTWVEEGVAVRDRTREIRGRG